MLHHFQGQSFSIFLDLRISRKRWVIEQTLLSPSDSKADIYHRIVPLRMLYAVTLTNIFNVTNFEMWISRKRCVLAKNTQEWLYRSWYFCHRTGSLRVLNSVTLTEIFKAKLFKYLFWLVNALKCKHYYCHQIENQAFAFERYHCKCYVMTYNFQGHTFSSMNYLENCLIYRKMLKYIF